MIWLKFFDNHLFLFFLVSSGRASVTLWPAGFWPILRGLVVFRSFLLNSRLRPSWFSGSAALLFALMGWSIFAPIGCWIGMLSLRTPFPRIPPPFLLPPFLPFTLIYFKPAVPSRVGPPLLASPLAFRAGTHAMWTPSPASLPIPFSSLLILLLPTVSPSFKRHLVT